MSQIRTGTVLVFQDSTLVTATLGADWSTVAAGDWFTVYQSGVSYTIASMALVVPAAYNAGSTYAAGDLVTGTDTFLYCAIASVAVSTPPPNITYWQQVSGYRITLTAPYAGITNVVAQYSIFKGFTPNYSFPLLVPGDVDAATILARFATQLDDLIVGSEPAACLVREDFLSIGDIQTTVSPAGKSFLPGWFIGPYGANTTPVIANVLGELNHPGIISITTGVLNHLGAITYCNTNYRQFSDLDDLEWEFQAIFRVDAITKVLFNIGIGQSADISGDEHRATLSFVSTLSTKLRYVARGGAAAALLTYSSIDLVAATWYKIKIYGLADNKCRFQLDDGNITTLAVCPASPVSIAFYIENAVDTDARKLEIDYVHFKVKGLVR
jgi:hypothetical protein